MANVNKDHGQADTDPTVLIQQHKLSEALQDYLSALASAHPFTKDIKVDARRVVDELSDNWPKLSGWAEQEHELWQCIATIVDLLPTLSTVPDTLVRVSVGASPLAPAVLPEPNEATVIATLDANQGIMKLCVLTGNHNFIQSLRSLTITSGLLVICQHVAPLNNRFDDNRSWALGNGANTYSKRERDPVVLRRGEEWDDDPESIVGPPDPGLYPAFQQLSPQYPTTSDPPRQIKMQQEGLSFFGKLVLAGAAYFGYKAFKKHQEKKREDIKHQQDIQRQENKQTQNIQTQESKRLQDAQTQDVEATEALRKERITSTDEAINAQRRQANVSGVAQQKASSELSVGEENIIAELAEETAATEREITLSPENSAMTARRPELQPPPDQMINAAEVQTKNMADEGEATAQVPGFYNDTHNGHAPSYKNLDPRSDTFNIAAENSRTDLVNEDAGHIVRKRSGGSDSRQPQSDGMDKVGIQGDAINRKQADAKKVQVEEEDKKKQIVQNESDAAAQNQPVPSGPPGPEPGA